MAISRLTFIGEGDLHKGVIIKELDSLTREELLDALREKRMVRIPQGPQVSHEQGELFQERLEALLGQHVNAGDVPVDETVFTTDRGDTDDLTTRAPAYFELLIPITRVAPDLEKELKVRYADVAPFPDFVRGKSVFRSPPVFEGEKGRTFFIGKMAWVYRAEEVS